MVHRIYVEKKSGFRNEAESLAADLKDTLGLNPAGVRVINRYDVDGLSDELFEYVVSTVFSESPVDDTYHSLPDGGNAFAVCPLPGQFDLRAASAAQCINFISPSSDVKVRSSKVYLIEGLSSEEMDRVKKYIINPVESMETSMDTLSSLDEDHPEAPDVPILEGFTSLSRAGLESFCSEYSLAMDVNDLQCFQEYFRNEGRQPSMSELRVCDTYWSDHCRHTTFLTALEDVTFSDSRAEEMFTRYLEMRKQLGITKPVTLMDIATIGAKYLNKEGRLGNLDESEEINACSIKIKASFSDGTQDDYLLMFKNETHNHPTEIEPFGGAATCIGGAIRDPLSGRAYVYQAMRISGSGNILESFDETMEGKLPQKKIGQTAAAGYSSYGNQIGLATGLVDEIYHPDYVAKHLELGAVVAAVRQKNVRRERPMPGDVVILVGGRTGRDGIGGATGSSKSHKATSVNTSGAEVQKGNAPEERKLQRLFRNPEASLLIKRCNDFGAGGVAVAIGELADGLEINLDLVKKKYMGLDGSEIAISESQERMAVVVAPGDKDRFLAMAESENLEAEAVAIVTAEPVLVMKWRGKTIVSLRRSFLNTNGASRKASAHVRQPEIYKADESDLAQALHSLRFCSRQGLAERFDSTIGAATVLLPYAGRQQRTPEDLMCALIPDENRRSTTASLFAYGFDPCRMKADPFEGAWHSVVTSVSKIVAAGGSRKGTYLSLQEFFGKTGKDREKWGLPLSALLGALKAQLDLGCAAIGGKDSMSGTFENIDVPPTLVSFAVNTAEGNSVISSALKKEKSSIYLVSMKENEDIASYLDRVENLIKTIRPLACRLVEDRRADVTLAKMCFGSMTGFCASGNFTPFCQDYSFIMQSRNETDDAILIGWSDDRQSLFAGRSLDTLLASWQSTLESVYPRKVAHNDTDVRTITSQMKQTRIHCHSSYAKPRVLIPVFPGTNCETDTKLAFEEAGAVADIFVINNLTGTRIRESISSFASRLRCAQILFIPGGFSGGDEPEGSGKFITAFLRNGEIKEEISNLLSVRDGLIGGICNGFQALIKLGLLPYGEFRELSDDSPTLTYNVISRHQSRLAMTRVSSKLSPWLKNYELGQLQMVPVSHGEGRFTAPRECLESLISAGQICTQYTDLHGIASMDIESNPNGSLCAVEGICSPDGRVFGRMGHVERCRYGLYRNVEESSSYPFFSGAVEYFR